MPSVFLKLNVRTLRDRRDTKWVNLDDLVIDLSNFERDLTDAGKDYEHQASSVRTIRQLLERLR